MRPGRAAHRPVWSSDLPLGDGGLGADSLERLRLGEAVAQALDLPDGANDLMTAATLGEMAQEARRLLPLSGGSIAFLTSSSTGQPKAVRHDLRLLWQEVEQLAAVVGHVRRIVALVPAQAIYGFLFTILLPRHLGVPVVDGRVQRPAALPTLVRPEDLIAATLPTWTGAAQGDWPAGVVGVTSGVPCPPGTLAALRGRGVRMVELYGATETGGIGWGDDEREPLRLLPYWEREGPTRLRRDAGGARLSAKVPDHVDWLGPNRLRPLARRDGAVQAPDGLPETLEDWARARLSAPERPRAITVGPALPVTPAGKPGDWSIEEP